MLDPTRGGLRPNTAPKSPVTACNPLTEKQHFVLFVLPEQEINIQLSKLSRLTRHDHGYEIETGSNFGTERLVRTVNTGNP